jgi:cytidine deaminase
MADKITRDEIQRLFDAAFAVQQRAHAPYSRFPVGAAVLDEGGAVHSGCNVENAAYPLGVCAESSAMAAMIAHGGRRVRALLVLGNGRELVTPCGGCRQRLREFANDETPVLVAGRDGVRKQFTLGELLPASFGPENLKP